MGESSHFFGATKKKKENMSNPFHKMDKINFHGQREL